MVYDVLNNLREALRAIGVSTPEYTPERRPALSREEWAEKFVYPPEHVRRPKPKRRYEHIILLHDAIEDLGRAVYGSAWKGTLDAPYEWYARSPHEILRWNGYTEIQRENLCTYQTMQKAVQFPDDENEIQVFERKKTLYSKLLTWLNQRKLEVFTLQENGLRQVIESHEWIKHKENYGNFAHDVFRCGRISGKPKQVPWYGIDPDGDKHDAEVVYFDKEQLEKFLVEIRPKKNVKDFSAPSTLSKHKDAYSKYHEEQVQNFLTGEVDQPWRGHTMEESAIKAKMGNGFNRSKFREARKSILARYSSVADPSKTRFSRNDLAQIKNFILTNQ